MGAGDEHGQVRDQGQTDSADSGLCAAGRLFREKSLIANLCPSTFFWLVFFESSCFQGYPNEFISPREMLSNFY